MPHSFLKCLHGRLPVIQGGSVVSLVNTVVGERLFLYTALYQNHMYPVPCSNTGLQDMAFNRLHRYCSESTNGSRSDVGGTMRILDHLLGELLQIFRLRGIHLRWANLFHIL